MTSKNAILDLRALRVLGDSLPLPGTVIHDNPLTAFFYHEDHEEHEGRNVEGPAGLATGCFFLIRKGDAC